MKLEKMKRKLEMGSDYEDSGSEDVQPHLQHHNRGQSPGHNTTRQKTVSEEEDTMKERDDYSDEELSDEEENSPLKDENGNDFGFGDYNPLLHFADILKKIRDNKEPIKYNNDI